MNLYEKHAKTLRRFSGRLPGSDNHLSGSERLAAGAAEALGTPEASDSSSPANHYCE